MMISLPRLSGWQAVGKIRLELVCTAAQRAMKWEFTSNDL